MPGIAGVIGHIPVDKGEILVRLMLASMKHEPFYVSGTYSCSDMGVYAGWVAPEHSFSGAQPLLNKDGDVVLLFSGECFMDTVESRVLNGERAETEDAGGNWLVRLYEETGDRFFEKLNGLFSGLLIDKRQRKAFLFNDRYGVERIYWYEANDTLFFASEAKALLRALPQLREFDQEGLTQFLTYGCTLEGRTLFRDVCLLPGASLWLFQNGRLHRKKYFSPGLWESQPILTPDAFVAEFQRTFTRILSPYVTSGAPVGISLTAGIDSRMIMACLPHVHARPICFTFSGAERHPLDARLASRVAQACGLKHHVLRLGEDFFSGFASYVDRTVYATDGALGSLGAHEIYLNRRARALSPVRLTGVFGGEILRGVSMYKPLHLASELFNPELAADVRSCRNQWSHRRTHPITFAAFHEAPEQRFAIPAASRSQTSFRTPYLDNELVALAYRAPEVIRTSSEFMISFIRANNAELANIPTDMGALGGLSGLAATPRLAFSKVVCKLDYLRNEGLPPRWSKLNAVLTQTCSALRIAGLHKFLHYRIWFKRELANYVDGVLNDSRARHSPLWNSRFVRNMTGVHAIGQTNYMREIDAVITIEAIERLFFRPFHSDQEAKETHSMMKVS